MRLLVVIFSSLIIWQATLIESASAADQVVRIKLSEAKSTKGNKMCTGPRKAHKLSLTGEKFKIGKSTFTVKGKKVVEQQSDCRFVYQIV